MQINSMSNAANVVPAMPYTPPSQQAAVQTESKQNSDLDQLFDQLSTVLAESVHAKDSSKPQALMALLDKGGSAQAAASLPADLVKLISKITGLADDAGQGDAFKSLLREYVAVKWALTELDAEIQARQAGEQAKADADDHYQQLAEADAFLRQLSGALSEQLDALAHQNGYTDWLQAFKADLDARSKLDGDAGTLPQGLDAQQLVAYLLRNAPRPAAEDLEPKANAPQPASSNPYH